MFNKSLDKVTFCFSIELTVLMFDGT